MRIALLLIAAAGTLAWGQSNPLSTGEKGLYTLVKNNIVRAVEKMPEEHSAFKPTPEVRSFGQLAAHIADAQYLFCSTVGGGKNPAPGVEKTKTTKAELSAALEQAFAYCDKVYDNMTDQQAAEIVKLFGREQPKLTVLSFNTAHNMEHYGNMVTYMRMKNLVPPSSEGRR